MNLQKIKITVLFVGLLLATVACEKLTDLNENPNQPENANMASLLPKIIKDLSNTMVNRSFLFANNAGQLTAKSLRVEVDVYNWEGFNAWTPLYNILRDVNDLETKAKQQGNPSYEAVAIILRSYIFSMLTDMYGDIPYSQAIQGSSNNNSTPVYDSQDSIYLGTNGLLMSIAGAVELLDNSTSAIGGDILFDGNLSKWKKFGNSLSLRLLIRVSSKTNISAKLAQLLADPNNVMSSNNDNAVLEYIGIAPNSNPVTALKIGDFDAVRISENLVTAMQATNDPRLERYARPTDATINMSIDSAQYVGWTNGADGCSTGGCRLGLSYYDYIGHPITPNKANAILMSHSEVAFLIAEAIQKGLMSGDAATYYRAGIESGMDYYNVNYQRFGWTNFNDFYTNATDVAYTGSLNQIWKQKWISLFFHGLEPYIEVRRWLDFHNNDWSQIPFLNPTCNNLNSDLLPVRFLYPQEEKVLNGDNYDAAVLRMGGDNQNSKMWLLQ